MLRAIRSHCGSASEMWFIAGGVVFVATIVASVFGLSGTAAAIPGGASAALMLVGVAIFEYEVFGPQG